MIGSRFQAHRRGWSEDSVASKDATSQQDYEPSQIQLGMGALSRRCEGNVHDSALELFNTPLYHVYCTSPIDVSPYVTAGARGLGGTIVIVVQIIRWIRQSTTVSVSRE